ncbi:MAG: hypothetical protein ABJA98_08320 [Acidobacteriota bacterium]
MYQRLTALTSLAAAAIVGTCAVAPLAGQATSGGNKVATATSASPAGWRTPRTPWGDPDIQGNFTNLYEQGTPLERPDQFAGRTLSEVRGEELKTLKIAAQERAISAFQGPIHAPDNWWQDALDSKRGSQAWLVTDPPDGKVPPMTDAAQRRIAARAEARRNLGHGPADSYEDRSLYDRCITRGLPGSMMPTIYGNSYKIVQGRGYVAIQYEMIHETRVIPLDGQPHAGRNIRFDMGDARGHWEGDTLVVETTNFNDRSVYRNANAETLKLVERFTRVGPNTVKWSVTFDDPSTWTRPWTFSLPLTRNDAEPMMQYECHEGNYGLRNILSGTRAEERNGGGSARPGSEAQPADLAAPAEER